ncbi:uncharacterized protein LOC134531205 [Bacillus rossius redtenbacheri]|uniref:uncharacterized protein LOC134531205 n=1 Tax=Bacillus rossius redtenbacheri TaxID=93214 RepID=UPI002FDE1224
MERTLLLALFLSAGSPYLVAQEVAQEVSQEPLHAVIARCGAEHEVDSENPLAVNWNTSLPSNISLNNTIRFLGCLYSAAGVSAARQLYRRVLHVVRDHLQLRGCISAQDLRGCTQPASNGTRAGEDSTSNVIRTLLPCVRGVLSCLT